MNETILVVDDEREIADLLEIYLKNDGYTVHTCATGAEALRCVESEHIDLALLDVMLPDIDGFSLCRKIRESRFFPILMLTARVADSDKILGLTIGADDYITKPFNPLEVVARVKTQLRRAVRYNQSAAAPEESGSLVPSSWPYAALVEGAPDSEALALAFQLLCDTAGAECTVVRGTLDGQDHFWNIVTVDAGVPVLSMHAPLELVSKLDCYETMLACKAIYLA